MINFLFFFLSSYFKFLSLVLVNPFIEDHMREVLYKDFGEIEGKKVLKKWKSQRDFTLSLNRFNDRRLRTFSGDYKNFLKDDYNNAYSAYYKKVVGPTYTKILATQSNLDFLSLIYGIPITLIP